MSVEGRFDLEHENVAIARSEKDRLKQVLASIYGDDVDNDQRELVECLHHVGVITSAEDMRANLDALRADELGRGRNHTMLDMIMFPLVEAAELRSALDSDPQFLPRFLRKDDGVKNMVYGHRFRVSFLSAMDMEDAENDAQHVETPADEE